MKFNMLSHLCNYNRDKFSPHIYRSLRPSGVRKTNPLRSSQRHKFKDRDAFPYHPLLLRELQDGPRPLPQHGSGRAAGGAARSPTRTRTRTPAAVTGAPDWAVSPTQRPAPPAANSSPAPPSPAPPTDRARRSRANGCARAGPLPPSSTVTAEAPCACSAARRAPPTGPSGPGSGGGGGGGAPAHSRPRRASEHAGSCSPRGVSPHPLLGSTRLSAPAAAERRRHARREGPHPSPRPVTLTTRKRAEPTGKRSHQLRNDAAGAPDVHGTGPGPAPTPRVAEGGLPPLRGPGHVGARRHVTAPGGGGGDGHRAGHQDQAGQQGLPLRGECGPRPRPPTAATAALAAGPPGRL